MSGVTDLSFRRLCRELSGENKIIAGCGSQSNLRFVSEFLSTDGSTFLTRINLKAMRFGAEEKPFCVQLFGIYPQKLADAAQQTEELGADFIELNAGCPAPKVAGKGGGAGLLKDLPNLTKILRTMKSAVKVPLFLKCRIGWDENSICINEVLKIAENEGVEQLTIHGRTRVQGYKGLANWDVIGEIASKAKIRIIGNGDINSIEKAKNAARKYGVAGVAVGRAALHNPWLLGQIANSDVCESKPQSDRAGEIVSEVKSGESCLQKEISVREVCDAVLRYAFVMEQDWLNDVKQESRGEISDLQRSRIILGKLKQFTARLCKGFEPSIPEFRLNLLHTQNLDEFLQIWLKMREWQMDTVLTSGMRELRFNPARLQNLNGLAGDDLEYGKQFR